MANNIIGETPRDPSNPLRLGVLVSGTGTILQALIGACERGELAASIELVLSDKKEAPALERARKAGLNVRILPEDAFSSSAEHSAAIVAALQQRDVEFVCLGGFSGPRDAQLSASFPNRILHMHGSLLPAFKELHPVRAALATGVRITGCTLSFVDPEGEHGAIFLQTAVAVDQDDDEEALAVRVHVAQQRSFVEGLKLICKGQVQLENERVVIDRSIDPDRSLEWHQPREGKAD